MDFRQLYETIDDQPEQIRELVGLVCHCVHAGSIPVGVVDANFRAWREGRMPPVTMGGLPGELWLRPDLRFAGEPERLPPMGS